MKAWSLSCSQRDTDKFMEMKAGKSALHQSSCIFTTKILTQFL